MAIRYPDEVKEFIIKKQKGRRTDELAALVNKKFGTDYTSDQMRYFRKNHKLKSGLSAGRKNPYSNTFPKEITSYIQKNFKGIGPKEMTEKLNKKFKKQYTKAQLKNYYANHGLNSGLTGHFEKGNIPLNGFKSGELPPKSIEHQFKKGHKPVNWRPVGSERVNVDGYVEIKTAEPNTWQLKQKVVWETKNGRVPDGCKIIFLDGNKENVSIENLAIVSNDEMLEMNRNGLRYDDPEATKTGILIAKVNRAAAKLQKGERNGQVGKNTVDS